MALVVADIEKAISLYQDLGADLKSRDLEKGPFIENLLGMHDVVIKTCKMHFQDNSRLELIQFISTPNFLQTHQGNDVRSKIGLDKLAGAYRMNINLNHIAFTVKDIEGSIRIIQSYGGRLHTEPVISTTEHSVHAVSAKHAYIFDPFENLLHLAQDLEQSIIT
jgi:catechol 2,3-dioxygenase-like lactoylglutathione lyase family enzyme